VKISLTIVHGLVFLGLSLWVACAPTESTKFQTIDEAIAQGDLQDVRLQLEFYPERANQGTHPKLRPLHQAILRQKTEIAKVLIEAGADVNAADPSKRTPLHLAVDRNLPEIASKLLEAGAKPNEWDKAGWTPLHNAAAKNRLEVAKVLVSGGADVDALSERGGTPLHEAAASADAELIRFLLDQGVDPAVEAHNGDKAYDVALEAGNEAAIELLKK